MTNVLSSLRTFLLAQSAVTALLGSAPAVYVVHVPPATARPYVVIHGISGEGHHHLRGASAIGSPLVQVECWAADGLAADAIADAVQSAVDGYRGRMDQLVVKGAFKRDRRGPLATDPQDGSALPLYSVQLDVEIWHAQ